MLLRVTVVEKELLGVGFEQLELAAKGEDLLIHLAQVSVEEGFVHQVADQRVAGKTIGQRIEQVAYLRSVEIHEHAFDDHQGFSLRVALAQSDRELASSEVNCDALQRVRSGTGRHSGVLVFDDRGLVELEPSPAG